MSENGAAVIPRMVVSDLDGAVGFLRAVFGATGDAPAGRPAQLRIGGSPVMVSAAAERAEFPAFLYVYVSDVDDVWARALAADARVIEEPFDTAYGERRAMLGDAFGNVFQIARRT